MSIAESWLWPDHVIGKRESRQLRDDHNATVNSHQLLLEACEAVASLADGQGMRNLMQVAGQARIALAYAKDEGVAP